MKQKDSTQQAQAKSAEHLLEISGQLNLEEASEESSGHDDFILVESKKKRRGTGKIKISPLKKNHNDDVEIQVQEAPDLPKKRGRPRKAFSTKNNVKKKNDNQWLNMEL